MLIYHHMLPRIMLFTEEYFREVQTIDILLSEESAAWK